MIMERLCGACLHLCKHAAASPAHTNITTLLQLRGIFTTDVRYGIIRRTRGTSATASSASSSSTAKKNPLLRVPVVQAPAGPPAGAAAETARPATAKKKASGKKRSASSDDQFSRQHHDMIKALHKRRHQLKARIQLLRERESAEKATRPDSLPDATVLLSRAPPTPATALTPSAPPATALLAVSADRRLDSLSAHRVGDPEHLEQDHLSNMSDFRLSLPQQVQPATAGTPAVPGAAAAKENTALLFKRTAKEKRSAAALAEASRRKQEQLEAQLAEKSRTDARMRVLNLKGLNGSLRAYILACTHSDMTHQAIAAFSYYRERYPAASDRALVLDVKVCNVLMNLFAKKGRMDRVKEIFHWMRADQITPDARSFALALETLGRQSVFDAKMARRIVGQMVQEKLTFKDLFERCSFILDEKEKVLEVIQKIQPGWTPSSIRGRPPYTPDIMHSLNQRPTHILQDTPYRGVTRPGQLEAQLQREMDGVVTVRSVDAPDAADAKTTACRDVWQRQNEAWREVLRTSFLRGREMLKNQVKGKRAVNVYPFLCVLQPEEYVDILVEELVRLAQFSESYSPSALVLDLLLGQKVMSRYVVRCKENYQIVDRLRSVYVEYLKYFDNPEEVSLLNCREKWQAIEDHLQLPRIPALRDHWWPRSVTVRVGKFLNDIIVNDVKIDVNCLRLTAKTAQYAPAIYKMFKTVDSALKEELRPHPVLVRLYKAASPETLTFDTTMCPTVVPPQPWTEGHVGGYVLQNTILTRLPETGSSVESVVDKVPPQQLYPVFDSLNQLGASPWIINKPMLDLVIGIFRNKGMPDVDIPPPVSECPPIPKIVSGMTDIEKAETYRERFRLKKKRAEMFSLWCDALYKLSIANHFRDSVFYFPHNIDFRGRVYPVPPHFHHLGGDMTRSILLFAKGMPLGDKGLDWLKIHLINLTGLKKKSSIAERLSYANEIMDDIIDSADQPLTGRQWWKSSDDPWQTLACCKEIVTAMRSPDHRRFVSHFPVHQDGSCNGLQHYAALGRDAKGAHSVNLAPADLPQDVYSGVAALVEEERKKDAAKGLDIPMALDGFVGRKVVKQTVMTIVYGVTRYGARSQIHAQLSDLKGFDQEKVWPAASYLAGKTFESIRQMFTATRQIQEWFVECARLISTVRERPVTWVTPLGLPVLQPYYKNAKQHQMSRQKLHIALDNGKINTLKQKNAFPPNFIHSLDSTHMMLTCLHSARAGISFVSVHDSYWTHPMTVEIMNKICREQFVAMHSLPILDNLSRYLVERYGFSKADVSALSDDSAPVILNKTLRNVPAKGEFDLSSVLRSVYFFS